MPRKRTIAVPRLVRIGKQGKGEGFGLTPRDGTFAFLTLGPTNPILQAPQKDIRFTTFSVTGLGPRRNGLAPSYPDAHYTHISPVI
jgi:hypothetical protein